MSGRKLTSVIDHTVNWVKNYGNSTIETRFVYKGPFYGGKENPNYIIAYVSSHSGCKMGCRQCHLTQMGDVDFKHVDINTYNDQLKLALDHYKEYYSDKGITRCNINFMAKGEALANKYVVNSYSELYDVLNKTGESYGLKIKPNISTIMPNTIKEHKLIDIFKDKPVYIYYSLYSMEEGFRKKWLPNAMDYRLALDKLKEYQEKKNEVITFHWAYIAGENDNFDHVNKIANILASYNFNAKLNIVRFNPPPQISDKETSDDLIKSYFHLLNSKAFNHNPMSYIVPRVGFDVAASCGMFIPKTL